MWRFWLWVWIIVAAGAALGQVLLAGNPKVSLAWAAAGCLLAVLIARPKLTRAPDGKRRAALREGLFP